MAKMSELDLVVQRMKECGEMLIGVAEDLAEFFSGEEKSEGVGESGKSEAVKVESAKVESAKTDVVKAEMEKVYSFTDVRRILAEKSRSGFTVKIKEILKKHGADKLSDIDPKDYAALMKEVEVLK